MRLIIQAGNSLCRRVAVVVAIVAIIPSVASLSYGQYALKSWGDNQGGQLGDNSTTGRSLPVTIESAPFNGGRYSYVHSGGNYSLAVRDDGSLWGWGSNIQAQLGNGQRSYVPVLNMMMIHTGAGKPGRWRKAVGGYNHSVGVREDGSLWAWGSALAVQNGHTNADDIIVSAVQIDPVSGRRWVDVDACGDFASFGGVSAGSSMGLTLDGELFGWGYGSSFIMANGSQATTMYPVKINDPTGTGWSKFAMGQYFVLAITNNGSIWGWGNNAQYQLGIPDGQLRKEPTRIDPGTDIGKGGKWKQVAAGTSHALAIRENGSLWGWGANWSGAVGDGTTNAVTEPKLIDNGGNGKWVQVVAGHNISLGIKDNGTVWAWGDNSNGISGDGTTGGARLSPQQISVLGAIDHTRAFLAPGWSSKHAMLITDRALPVPLCFAPRMVLADISPTSAVISWDRFPGITNFEFALDQSQTTAPAGAPVTMTDTFYNATMLTPGARYYAHIRTNCSNGEVSRWDTISFYAAMPCQKPAALWTDMVTSNGADVYWSSIGTGAEYEIAIDESPTLIPAVATATTQDTFYFSYLLKPGTTYYVHLRSRCGGANVSAWDTISFRTHESCADPIQIKLHHATANTATITWQKQPHIIAYHIAVDSSATLQPSGPAIMHLDTVYEALNLTEGRLYYVHLRADCPGGLLGVWDTLSFRAGDYNTGISGTGPDAGHILIYPNPVQNILFVASAGKVMAKVYAADGRLLLTSGRPQEGIPVEDLPEGVYLLHLTGESGQTIRTERFLKTNSGR